MKASSWFGLALLLAAADPPALTAAGERRCTPSEDRGSLAAGTVVRRQLAGGQSHQHPIFLCAGEYLGAVVEQLGIDVYVLAHGPDGEGLARFDSPNHDRGPEPVLVVAERDGVHRLEVGAVYQQEQGEYEVRVLELRPATEAERHGSLALRAKLEAIPFLAPGASVADLRRALPLLERSLDHQRAASDVAGQAQAYNELTTVHGQLGNSLEALAAARSSLELWRRAGDRRQEVLAQFRIASLYSSVGEDQKAIDFLRWALATSRRERDRLSEADALQGLGTLLASLDEPEEALAALEPALALWRDFGHPERQARTLIEIGSVHAGAGRHDEAIAAFRQAQPLSRSESYYRRELDLLVRTSRSLIALGCLKEAETVAREALAGARRAGHTPGEVRALAALAAAAEARGDAEAALSLYEQAHSRPGSGHVETADVLFAVARLELRNDRLDRALAAIRRAVDQLHARTAQVGDRELAAGYLAGHRRYHELHLGILMRLHERQPAAGWDARAFETHEEARAQSLIEGLGEVRDEPRRGVDPELLAEERELLERLAGWRTPAGPRSPDAPEQEVVLSDSLARLQEVQALIRAQSSGAGEPARPRALSLPELREQVLDPDTVLLEYALGEPRSFLFAITASRLSTFALPGREEIEAGARRFHRLLEARGERLDFETREDHDRRIREADTEAGEVAAELSEMLLAPAASLLGSRRLLIVADGALHFLPWAALPEPGRWGAAGRDPAPPLIARHELIDAPSASVVAALRERSRDRRPAKTLAVVADPVYETPEANLWQRLSGWLTNRGAGTLAEEELLWPGPVLRSFRDSGTEGFPPLPGSRREAEAILELVPESERLEALGYLADRELVLGGALRDYRIVHFAAHGILNGKHPDLSGLVLSLVGEDGEPRNGFLRLVDIYRLELSADLVVLSACRTALGREVRGEGLDGLVRGFFHAGATLVVASL